MAAPTSGKPAKAVAEAGKGRGDEIGLIGRALVLATILVAGAIAFDFIAPLLLNS